MPEENNNTPPTSLESTEPVLETVPDPATSEKPKKKSSSAYITAVIVLAIFALAGIGFGVYAWFFRPTEQVSSTCECEKCEECKECEECKKCVESEIECPGAAERYKNYLKNVSAISNKSAEGAIYRYNAEEKTNDVVYIFAHIHEGHLSIHEGGYDGSMIYNGDGYVDAFYVQLGNGAVPYFYFIKNDGSIERMDISEGKRTIEKVEGYSNIVFVKEDVSSMARLVDIDGNSFLSY